MAEVVFKGKKTQTKGRIPQVGSEAPYFFGVRSDLSDFSFDTLKGYRIVLNVFPSLDTSVCARSVRRFNEEAAALPNTVVLAISKDLPFAHGRFCATEGIDHVTTVSTFRHSSFEDNYGMLLIEGPLKGLLARCVFVIDEKGKIVYTELVPEIEKEPNYEAAIASLT
ncbi:MAG: thiol peroxidase [Tannerellaceae bacterium]|jgi:thiol peroxidase|nr:thiol peroxidase [Tannerellaceae bacterium]